MICKLTSFENAAPLFGNWQESVIWSCLQGVMGKIYANQTIRSFPASPPTPATAKASRSKQIRGRITVTGDLPISAAQN